MEYLIRINGKKICVPTPKIFKDGEIADVTVSRVFVDEQVNKSITEKALAISEIETWIGKRKTKDLFKRDSAQ
jgi:hypothetical protein